jgi:hypothetical protein
MLVLHVLVGDRRDAQPQPLGVAKTWRNNAKAHARTNTESKLRQWQEQNAARLHLLQIELSRRREEEPLTLSDTRAQFSTEIPRLIGTSSLDDVVLKLFPTVESVSYRIPAEESDS